MIKHQTSHQVVRNPYLGKGGRVSKLRPGECRDKGEIPWDLPEKKE